MQEFLNVFKSFNIDMAIKLIFVVLGLLVGIVVIKLICDIVKKAMSRSSIDEVMYNFIITIVKYGLYVLLLIAVMDGIGIPTAPLITALGACGAAIALALKDSLSNVASGILLLMNKPFMKGDYIIVDSYEGNVESIELTYTKVITVDNREVMVPNSTITNNVMINTTAKDLRRVDVELGISYSDDIEHARQTLLKMTEGIDMVLREPQPQVVVSEHKDSSVALILRCWTKTEFYFDTKFELIEKAKLAFDEAGISIPFPQVDVHMIK